MDEQMNYQPPVAQQTEEVPQGGKGLSIASMVLGIVAVVFGCCFYYVSIPCGVIGLILGAMSLSKKKAGKGMAITGLVLSIVAIALSIVVIVTAGAILSSMPWSEWADLANQ